LVDLFGFLTTILQEAGLLDYFGRSIHPQKFDNQSQKAALTIFTFYGRPSE
jgi:hypothetical protein